MKILRHNSLTLKGTNGLQVLTVQRTNTAGGAVTIETQAQAVLFEIAKEQDATATLAATIGSSSTYSGTKTVAYTVGAGKVLEAVIICTNGYTDTATVSGAVTVDNVEVF